MEELGVTFVGNESIPPNIEAPLNPSNLTPLFKGNFSRSFGIGQRYITWIIFV
jgi:hypothetical protein